TGAALMALFLGAGLVSGWVTQGSWPSGGIVMHLQLGSSGRLSDGSTSWGPVAESALAEWNGFLRNVEFRVSRDSTVPIRSGDRVNSVFWSTTSFGQDFDNHSGRAVWWFQGNTLTEVDVVFNSNFSWDSYRGAGRRTSSGTYQFDFRRIALHEFGHVLGLLHPFEHGQNTRAIMNYDLSVETVQTDDAQGVASLYGAVQAANHAPTVTATCSPCTIGTGGAVTLSASASDPDGDSLSYAWSVSSGTVANSGSSSTAWTAPSTAATVTATVTVTDSSGASASSSVSISVTVSDRLRAGGRLLAGQAIVSPNSRYRLVYQSDGNLVLYDNTAGTATWFAGTSGAPGQVVLQTDGNMVIYSAGNAALWFTGTPGNPGAFLALQSDGNLVLYSAAGAPLWVSARGGTMVPIPGGLATVSGCVVTVVATGQSVSIAGTLAATDCAAPSKATSRGDVYMFQGAAGQTVTITMTAGFDAFLNLIGPDGAVVASDDDSGGGTNSRIVLRLTAAGAYRIEATAFSASGLGPYTLTVN
ncbi:MAG: pre-peptidase C-terminal domain-containing protein, partial [Vicinamibacterales bacterium]|nr:pre-peptidase C-terminal domain-containing protein [Vicinamibacterales bacterium]